MYYFDNFYFYASILYIEACYLYMERTFTEILKNLVRYR